MIASTLFVRIVPADRARGFLLLLGWDAKIVQATAVQITTLAPANRADLDATIARTVKHYTHSEVRDVTAEGVKSKLRVLFDEPKVGKVEISTED